GGTDMVKELNDIKATQAKILERLDEPLDTQLTGSNVEDKLDRIARSETIESGSSTGLLDLGITNEKRIFVYVNVDKSPWTLRATRSTSNRYSTANLLIPQRRLESEVEVNGNLAIGTMLLSIDHLDLDLERPDTMTEAINL